MIDRNRRVELTSRPVIDLPPEPDTVVPHSPLSLPDDEPQSLMPFATQSAILDIAEAPVEERVSGAATAALPSPKSPYLWPGVIALIIGLLGTLASLNDPFDGRGQWLAPVGCVAFALAGAMAVTRLSDLREALVAVPLTGLLLGAVRADPLIAIASAALAGAMWLGTEDEDERPLGRVLGLFAAVPAATLIVIACLGAWLDAVPMADAVAWARRQGTSEASRVEIDQVLSFDATGWRTRPATDVSGAQEWTWPAIRATLAARVVKLDSSAPTYESQLAQATADFRKRGWVDFAVAENNELSDEADESHLVTFRARRGLTWSAGLLRMARVDDRLCVVVALVSERRIEAERDKLLAVTSSVRCSHGGATIELQAETLRTVRKGLVTLRAGDRIELGVVIEQRDGQLLILADDAWLGDTTPPALTYRPLLTPGDELRRATILRRKPGVLLLLAEADEGLVPLPLMPPSSVELNVVTVGLADDAVSSRLLIRPGMLSRRTLGFDPSVTNTSGPILTGSGTLVGVLRAGEGATRGITMLSDVDSLLGPGIRTLLWRVNVDDNHLCTVAVRVELDDPFHELEDFALLFGAPHHEDEVRREKVTGRTNSTLVVTLPCPEEKVLSIGLRALGGGQNSKLVESTELPTELPGARRGQRIDPTRPATPDLTMLTWLFEPVVPKPAPCSGEECTRACGSGAGEACLVLGLNLHAAGRANLAINDYERGCVAKNYEACIQLSHLAGPRTPDTFTAVLKPWCEVGITRACTALNAAQWRDQVKKENTECAKDRDACDREAVLLLEGPRRPAEVQKARTLIDRRCREGAPEMCVRSGAEAMKVGDKAEANEAFDKGCRGGVAEACVELAGFQAIGVGAPRNVEAAARLLRVTCDKGNANACSAIARTTK